MVRRVRKVPLVLPVLMAQLARKVLLVPMARSVRRVLLVRKVPLAQPVPMALIRIGASCRFMIHVAAR